jgi:hypothetical protein
MKLIDWSNFLKFKVFILLFLFYYPLFSQEDVKPEQELPNQDLKILDLKPMDEGNGYYYWLDYWRLSGEMGLNLAQTDQWNWTDGGYKHFDAVLFSKLKLLYQKDKLSWESQWDAELGIMYSSELLPVWRKSTDKINFASKFGYKVANNIYVTGLMTFKSYHALGFRYPQQHPALPEPKRVSNFLAPAYTDISIGVDWKYKDWLSVYFSPAAGLVTSCYDSLLRADYGVPVEKRSITTVGPKVKINFNKELVKDLKLATVLELYTPYKDPIQKFGNFKVDWDLTLSYQFLKMLQFRVSTSLKYNEKVRFDEWENGKDQPRTRIRRVQFKEIIGVGIVYSLK